LTPANVTDTQGFKHIAPKQGAVYGDKGFCIRPARLEMQKRGLHGATINLNKKMLVKTLLIIPSCSVLRI